MTEDRAIVGPEESGVAVLVSGGVESCVLLSVMADEYERVVPIYVRTGLVWEEAESRGLAVYIGALDAKPINAMVTLDFPISHIYGEHWSVTREDVPDGTEPDEAFILPGRNMLLFSAAAVWCYQNGIGSMAHGTLATNSFPDAAPEFFDSLAGTLSAGFGRKFELLRPFAEMKKVDVIRLGCDLPLERSFSCVSPLGYEHCGVCGKCAERRRGFAAAGIDDGTLYVDASPVVAQG